MPEFLKFSSPHGLSTQATGPCLPRVVAGAGPRPQPINNIDPLVWLSELTGRCLFIPVGTFTPRGQRPETFYSSLRSSRGGGTGTGGATFSRGPNPEILQPEYTTKARRRRIFFL